MKAAAASGVDTDPASGPERSDDMGTRDRKAGGKVVAGGGADLGKPAAGTPARRKSASDALREEAERSWAEADRKAARGQRRAQGRAKRRGEARDRDAEIQRLKGKLAQAQRGPGKRRS